MMVAERALRRAKMCLLLFAYGVSRDAVAIIGANREEAYERGGEPPGLHRGERAYIGGIDPRAGGTWLGVNDCGVLAAITNRPDRAVPAQARSRGLLVRDLLDACSSAEAAELASAELTRGHYGGCNIVLLDSKSGHAISASTSVRSQAIQPGLHALSSSDVDDKSDRRISYALWKLRESEMASADHTAGAFRAICSDNSADAPPLCLHGPQGGTVSSSVIILRVPVRGSEIWHCQGSPDCKPYVNCSHLFCELGHAHTGAVH
jgi:uncharacterized protein with NRDE domain